MNELTQKSMYPIKTYQGTTLDPTSILTFPKKEKKEIITGICIILEEFERPDIYIILTIILKDSLKCA